MGGLVEMKIHYREFTLSEEMNIAIRDSKKPIDYFEITSHEFDMNYSHFGKTHHADGTQSYSYKGIPVKVKQ